MTLGDSPRAQNLSKDIIGYVRVVAPVRIELARHRQSAMLPRRKAEPEWLTARKSLHSGISLWHPSVAECGWLGIAAARSFPGTGNNPFASNQNITTLKSTSTSQIRYPTQTLLESELAQTMSVTVSNE